MKKPFPILPERLLMFSRNQWLLLFVPALWLSLQTIAHAENWPQFRGINATGLSTEEGPLPVEMENEQHLLWKTDVGKGHSSPVIWGNHVYLTTLKQNKLLTLALNAKDGTLLWEAAAEYEKLERVHRIGSVATPSVVTDGKVVVSFFGSSGLHCYDTEGKLLWKKAMGPFDNGFGSAGSPILVDEKIVMVQDHDTRSFLAAFHQKTGEELWRVDRTEFRRNYTTPVVWKQNGVTQIVVAGTAQVNAYDLQNGERLWTVLKSSRVVSATPVVGNDGRLYVVNSGGGNATTQPTFASLLKTSDKNNNQQLEQKELPNGTIRNFLSQFDRDKNGALDEAEYTSIRNTMIHADPIAMAITPGGTGDITNTHVDWTFAKSLPRNSSPLLVHGKIFMIKDGGILTVLDAKTGEQLNIGRLKATGKFFSSPISGDGKIYAATEEGKLNVISAEQEWKQLATVNFGENVYATPAIANGRFYLRTVKTLYCFGLKNAVENQQ